MTRSIHPAVYELWSWTYNSALSIDRMSRQLKRYTELLPDRYVDVRSKATRCQKTIDSIAEEIDELSKSGEDSFTDSQEDKLTRNELVRLEKLNSILVNIYNALLVVRSNVIHQLKEKTTDTDDLMYDYEIEAKLSYYLREDDRDYSDEEDNIIATRIERLNFDSFEWRSEPPDEFPPEVSSRIRCCWFLHDLYDHDYGGSSCRLSLRDCLRIGSVEVDVRVIQQYRFDIPDEATQP